MATVVTEALRERLRQLQKEHNAGLAERLVAIGKDCAARLAPPYDAIDHGELLYDEEGLPR